MEIFKEILLRVLGTNTLVDYIVLFIFIGIGVTISIRLGVNKRDKYSQNTPIKFNIWFFILDNLQRAISSVFIAFLLIRFGEGLIGRQVTELGALGIGCALDIIKDSSTQYLEKFRCYVRDKFKNINNDSFN